MNTEQKAKYEKLFNGIKKSVIAVSDFEEIGVDCNGQPIYNEVYYYELWLDFSDDIENGIEFINKLSKNKLKDIGFNLYKDKFNKSLMITLLKHCGKTKITLE